MMSLQEVLASRPHAVDDEEADKIMRAFVKKELETRPRIMIDVVTFEGDTPHLVPVFHATAKRQRSTPAVVK